MTNMHRRTFLAAAGITALAGRRATAYPEIHSLVFATEGTKEYLYATVQKGTPQENWVFLKMKTDGQRRAQNHGSAGSWLQVPQ